MPTRQERDDAAIDKLSVVMPDYVVLTGRNSVTGEDVTVIDQHLGGGDYSVAGDGRTIEQAADNARMAAVRRGR